MLISGFTALVRMNTLELNAAAAPLSWNQVEVELLTHVRAAEVEFQQAPEDQKEQAGEKYRQALARFSELILDRRFPRGFQLPS